jgi:uncharacterized membrane protein
MTERLVLILAVAVATYATRLAGLVRPTTDRPTPPAVDRFLAAVPVAAFAALAAAGLTPNGAGDWPQTAASVASGPPSSSASPPTTSPPSLSTPDDQLSAISYQHPAPSTHRRAPDI